VLVVEDDGAVRDLVRRHLENGPYDVTEADSAEAVLERLRTGALNYDVALLDVHLPGMSGVELGRLLLATAPLRPLLVITGDDDQGLAREALERGATGYLLKPFELFELDAALAQAVAVLELVETTETLARSQAEERDDWGEAGGLLPRTWLHLGDAESGAGTGHGARVVSITGLLAKLCADGLDAGGRDVLRTAARTHEIGRLLARGGVGGIALRSAQLLDDLGFDPEVGEVVRRAAEPWAPDQPLIARILSLADHLDHDAVDRQRGGDEAAAAIRRAVDAVARHGGERHDPELTRRLMDYRDRFESMWVLQRRAVSG
jgi:CheY-like chemotaxis protein